MTSKRSLRSVDKLEKGDRLSVSQRRTCLERILILLLCAALLAVVVLAVLLSFAIKPEDSDICLTKECTEIAARVNSFIDYNVDPCKDFYDFACGSWMKNNFIPDDSGSVSVLGTLVNNVQRSVRKLLESTRDDHVSAVQKARNYYLSCMNETYIEHLGPDIFLARLEYYGGWPTLGDEAGGRWNSSEFDLVSSLVKLRAYKMMPLLRIVVSIDAKNNKRRILQIKEPSFPLSSRTYYFDDRYAELRHSYTSFYKNMAVLLGASPDVAEMDITKTFELEKALSNLTLTNLERNNISVTYNKMTIAELEANYTLTDNKHNFNWTTFLQMVMDVSQDNVTLSPTDEIIVTAPRYVENFLNILEQYDERTLQNYIAHFFVIHFADFLPRRFKQEKDTFIKAYTGVTNQPSRWKICSTSTLNMFGMAVARLFVEENFDEEAKNQALDMIHNIREIFYERLGNIDWMDTLSKQRARDKVKNIREQVGYPDFILDDEKLNDYYEKYTGVEPDAYFNNTLQFIKMSGKLSLEKLREPYEKDYDTLGDEDVYTWIVSPSTVNAFYNPLSNQIAFPAAVLQPPYYSKFQPKSMNYGSIGWFIGHEIVHAFDDRGRMYDKNGNVKQWWSNDAIAKFKSRTKCFKNQYSRYVAPQANISLDGAFTLGENIADNGGLHQCFKAYKRWQKRTKIEEPRLPGLDFTHDQLFFVNMAQSWCGKSTKEVEINQLNTDTHSLYRFRVLGSLQNSFDFAKAFKCPYHSPMNPVHKCKIW